MTTCSDCKRDYWIDVVMSSEDWERLTPDGAYALCPDCICVRLNGEQIECVLWSQRWELRSAPEQTHNWRFPELVPHGSRGHPELYKAR